MERGVWITWWIIFCIRYSRIFWKYIKKHGEKINNNNNNNNNNASVKTYVNRENRITFKIYYLELLTTGTMKLLGSTKSKITKHENGENVPHLEITEVVLIQCNVVNNNYNKIQE